MDDVLEIVLRRLRELADTEDASITVDADTQLLEENIWSSLDFLDLVSFLEEQFGFEADPDALAAANFLTPAAIARFVEQARQN